MGGFRQAGVGYEVMPVFVACQPLCILLSNRCSRIVVLVVVVIVVYVRVSKRYYAMTMTSV